jgi:hypothetical protein
VNSRYQPLESARFVETLTDGRRQIEIPARRNWFVLLFLCFWLTMWTMGGGIAIFQLLTEFQPFLLFWLCAWALGWLYAAATIGWQLTGREIVRVINADLEVGYRLLGIERMKLYRGSEVTDLSSSPSLPSLFSNAQISVPFFKQGNFGIISFNYGARTQRFGSGLDPAEGKLIVEKLQAQLPLSVRAIHQKQA